MIMEVYCCDICGKSPLGGDYMTLSVGDDPEADEVCISDLLGKHICNDCCRLFFATKSLNNMKFGDAFDPKKYTTARKNRILKEMKEMYDASHKHQDYDFDF